MTGIAVGIVFVGLLAVVAQSVVLVLLWGQHQRTTIQADHLGQLLRIVSGESIRSAIGHAAELPKPGAFAGSVIAPPSAQPTSAPTERTGAVPPTPVAPAAPPPVDVVKARPAQPVPATTITANHDTPFKPTPNPAPPRLAENRASTAAKGGLPAGSLVPDFELFTLDGQRFRRSLLPGAPAAIMFVSLDSPASRSLVETLRGPAGRNRKLPKLVLVVSGGHERDAVRRWLGKTPKEWTVLVQEETELSTVLRVGGTPAAYLLDEQSVTRGELRSGAAAILEGLGFAAASLPGNVRKATDITPQPVVNQRTYRGLDAGAKAPTLEQMMLDGTFWNPAVPARNRAQMVVFWDYDCPPCAAMLGEFASRSVGWSAFDTVVIARGSAEENTELIDARIVATIGLQKIREISRAFQVLETPAAIEIDATGTIARRPAVGRNAIFQLASELQDGHVS